MTGGQAEMREDLGNHGGIYDGGDDLQGSAALETLFSATRVRTAVTMGASAESVARL